MGYSSYVRERMEKTSLEMSAEKWIRLQIKATAPLSLMAAFSVYFITENVLYTLLGFLVSFVLVFIGFAFALDYFTYLKAKEVEEFLPEALELLASNVKAGLPVKESLQRLMNEEFGQLGREMTVANTEMSTGMPIVEALRGTRRRVDSVLYGKTIETLSRSIESGVNMDKICSSLARNINDLKNIRREIRSSTVTYTLFLGFAALIASPVLFALSAFLVEASTEIFALASAQSSGGAPLGLLAFSTTLPPLDLLRNFFLLSIGLISFFTALGIGIVKEGSMRVGLKYAPVFMIISFTVFFVAKGFIGSIVGISV